MLCVVIVLLGFHARIGNVIDLDGHAKFFRRGFHHARQLHDRELFGELVVYAAFALSGRIVARDLDAPDRVANVEESARLTALAIDRERLADGGLHAEPIEDRAEHIVIIEAIDECFIERRFSGRCSVNYALIEIRGANSPDLAREHYVVAVVHLREVVKRSWLLREGNYILATVVLDGDVALLDVDVRRAVFAHGPQFDEVAVPQEFTDGEKYIQCTDDIVHLSEDGMLAVDHRIGSRALFREMHHGFGLERVQRGGKKVVIRHVANEHFNGLAGQVLPHPDAIRQRTNRSERLRSKLVIPQPPQLVVNDSNRMPLL